LSGITADQVRRFADTGRLPASPLWRIVKEIVDRAVSGWRDLPEKDLLPERLRSAIGNRILAVAGNIA
jgi:hypothetical protein